MCSPERFSGCIQQLPLAIDWCRLPALDVYRFPYICQIPDCLLDVPPADEVCAATSIGACNLSIHSQAASYALQLLLMPLCKRRLQQRREPFGGRCRSQSERLQTCMCSDLQQPAHLHTATAAAVSALVRRAVRCWMLYHALPSRLAAPDAPEALLYLAELCCLMRHCHFQLALAVAAAARGLVGMAATACSTIVGHRVLRCWGYHSHRPSPALWQGCLLQHVDSCRQTQKGHRQVLQY